jgi:hypothetical protein
MESKRTKSLIQCGQEPSHIELQEQLEAHLASLWATPLLSLKQKEKLMSKLLDICRIYYLQESGHEGLCIFLL